LKISFGETFGGFLGKHPQQVNCELNKWLQLPNPGHAVIMTYTKDGAISMEEENPDDHNDASNISCPAPLPSYRVKLKDAIQSNSIEEIRIHPNGNVDICYKYTLLKLGSLLDISLKSWDHGQDPKLLEVTDTSMNVVNLFEKAY